MAENTENWKLDFDRPSAEKNKVVKALDIARAIEYVFENSNDGITLHWGSHKIKVQYAYGVSDILGDLIDMLKSLEEKEKGEYYFGFTMNEPNGLDADWFLDWDADRLNIRADWRMVPGGIDLALKNEPRLQISRQYFRESWGDLLAFLLKSVDGISLDYEDEIHRISEIITRVRKDD